MLKKHQELLAALTKAHELAVAIEREGGAVMGIIHHVRSASELTTLRVENYKQGEADAKAEADEKAKATAAAGDTGKADGVPNA